VCQVAGTLSGWSHHQLPITPAKTTGNQFSPIKPTQSIGNLNDDTVCGEDDSTLQKVALQAPWPGKAARSRPPGGLGDRNQESTKMKNGRGRNPVFSLKEMFSLLYLVCKLSRLCVHLAVSAWDT